VHAHIGANASFIGDTNVSAVNKNSTVIINSSYGKTETLKTYTRKEKEVGAQFRSISSLDNRIFNKG